VLPLNRRRGTKGEEEEEMGEGKWSRGKSGGWIACSQGWRQYCCGIGYYYYSLLVVLLQVLPALHC